MEFSSENIKKLFESIHEIRNEILENRKEITNTNTTIAPLATCLQNCITEIKSVIENLRQIENKVSMLESKVNICTSFPRQNNIIIYNVKEDEEFTNLALRQKLIDTFEKIDVKINELHINKCYRLNCKTGTRPILLSLNCNWIKSELLQKHKALKELGFGISPDRSKEEREAFKQALPKIIELRKKGLQVKFQNKSILVNNLPYDPKSVEITSPLSKKRQISVSPTPSGNKRKNKLPNLESFKFSSRKTSDCNSKSNQDKDM
jgi:hypothetical protein